MNIARISDFLASAAGNFRSHYLELAARNKVDITSHSHLIDPGTTGKTGASPVPDSKRADRLVPSGTVSKEAVAKSNRSDETKQPRRTLSDRYESTPNIGTKGIDSSRKQPSHIEHDDDDHHHHSGIEKRPDGTYTYQRRSSLEFKLDMRFELDAITRTAQSLENGNITAVDSFAAAGFGLKAAMKAQGRQEVESSLNGNADELATELRLKEKSRLTARAARQFAYQDENLAVKALADESLKVRRSLDVKVHDNHRRAVNKIAMRFRTDSSFSFAQASRFNVQTNRVAEQAPDAVGQYLDTIGQVASSSGSSNLVSGFFDAVDSYLDDSEQAMLDKVTAFFEMAAGELGFSNSVINTARENVTRSITRFFDNVESALDSIAERFSSGATVPGLEPPATLPTPLADILPTGESAVIETDQEKALLAVA